MSRVCLSDLRKTYGGVEVIHGVTLDIPHGELLALIGPSGCGKSTLLRMIGGLETITSGEIRFGDRRVNDLDPKQRNVAMVFQNYALYPHMTVRENISLNLRISRMEKAEIARRVAEVARLLHLESYLDRRPEHLSGGQRQRVAMGRAIVRDPAVFLFDEPLSNLDAKLRVQMRTEIKALHQKVGTTSIYVTHDQIEAMTLADRIVILNEGAVEQIGAPIELYQSPSNRFVAGFVGSPAMNFLNVEIESAADQVVRLRIGRAGSAVMSARLGALGERSVELGIRPEHLYLMQDGGGFAATVRMVEPTGAQTFLLLDCDGQDLTVTVDGGERIAPGQSVSVGFDGSRAHLFSKRTGKVIPPAGRGQ